MTFLWRTFFSLAGLPLAAATVTGKFEIAATHPVRNHGGIIVWLEPVAGKPPLPPPTTATILQKGKRFNPHITVVTVGSIIDLPNRDPIFHNAFSNFAGQPFDTGLYPPGGTQRVQFRREGVVRVFCNIHSSMSAIILVLGTPYFAGTGADGSIEMRNVPSGEYNLKLFYERATGETLKSLERRVTITGDTSLPTVRISEAGFVAEPHLNKYGREYGPEPPDKIGYRGSKP